MQENLEKLKEGNGKIRREIRQRMGQCLNDLSFQDLRSLEKDMETAWKVIHERAEAMDEDPYGLVDNGGDYNSVMKFRNEGPCILALRLEPNLPNLHREAPDLTTNPLL
ncbi:unnamed protein product [Dovyalis caffra]|uniref:K-box domain-containing protein n=1 Tax=Dovyalis caffra TaxID=77055 RepID=A0AAV1S4P5_9ROSI|nr:unnamed protein product [Dovyalis caffra]